MSARALRLCADLGRQTGVRWMPVPLPADKLVVSELGEIHSLPGRRSRGKILKQQLRSKGYRFVGYNETGTGKRRFLSVHRAVLMAFVSMPPPGRPHVNHKDHNPLNNRLDNLEWCSPAENNAHRYSSWRIRHWDDRHAAKLTSGQVINIFHVRGEISGPKLAALYGVDDQTIYDIWKRRTWKHLTTEALA